MTADNPASTSGAPSRLRRQRLGDGLGRHPKQLRLCAWFDGEGAAGYTGLTLHAMAAGKPIASLTLAGYSTADLQNGRLSLSYGDDAASHSPYLYITRNS